MAKVHAPLLAFNRGEVSKHALARVDTDFLRLAAECQVNWLPHVMGPMMLRPGLKHLSTTRSSAAAKFLSFIFSNNDTALIELTASHMRVWVDDAVSTVASVSTSVTNGDFSSGVGWTLFATSGASSTVGSGKLSLHARALGSGASAERAVTVAGGDQNVAHRLRIVVDRGPVLIQIGSTSGAEDYFARTSLGTGTHSIAFTPTGATFYPKLSTTTKTTKVIDSITVESSGALDLPTPWGAGDLAYIRHTQSGDIVYVVCDGFQPRQIERRDNNSWSVVLYEFEAGPFSKPPEWASFFVMDPTLLNGGTQAVTVSSAYFTSDHNNALLRYFNNDQNRQEDVAASSQYTRPIRVSGVTATDRTFNITRSGTWVGTLSLQRSLDGPTSGYVDVTTYTTNATTPVNDSADFANVDVWYRAGFKDAAYTSGSCEVTWGYSGTDPESPIGYSRITSVTNSTSAEAEHFDVPSGSGTRDWEISEWSGAGLWPTAVGLHDGRLWMAAADRLWGSVSDDYTNFDDQTEGDSAPISRSIATGPIAIINWLLPLSRLIIGCEGAETSVRSSAFDEPLTPTNFTLKECSTQGSANLPALKVDTKGVFVEKSGRRVYELAYNIQIQDYNARDLTHLNTDIGSTGFVSLAASRQPDANLHFVRGDGEVAVLVQSTTDEVEAWWRVMTLGVVEDVVVLPGDQEDNVYYVVKRTINGSTVRYLEKFALRTQCQGGSLSRNLDSHVVVSQASSTTITGLSHLEGETVCVWGNGKDLGTYTVSSGQITGVSEAVTSAIVGLGGVSFSYDSASAATSVTCATKYNGYPCEVFADGRYIGAVTIASGIATLPNGRTAKKITAYLGFYAPFRSAKMAYGAQMGTALNQKKKIEKLGVLLYDTHYQGLKYGSDIHSMANLPATADGQDTASDTVWSEFDQAMFGLSGSWDSDSRLHLLAQAPRPATVAGVTISVQTNEAR